MFKVGKHTIVMLLSILWAIAGLNILHIGVVALVVDPTHLLIKISGAAIVFALFFWFIFKKVSKRNIARIHAKEGDRHTPLAVLDIRGYVLMIFMICLGIAVRKFGWMGNNAIAIFYIGLSSALLATSIESLIWVYKN